MTKDKTKEAIKILEENKLTNVYSPEQQIAKTLEDEKEELESSMKSSRNQEYVRKEMDKIRAEGKMKEESVSDTHKIIYEAEKRVAHAFVTTSSELEEMAKQWPEYTLEELKKEQALADYAEKFKIKDKEVPTVSEKMQEELEPLPYCPMADD